MIKFKEVFLEFFRDGQKFSMARLITFICVVAAFVASLGAVWVGIDAKLTYEYTFFVLSLWGAAFGGKNWSKNVEVKNERGSGKIS